jgi:hypothetical protein
VRGIGSGSAGVLDIHSSAIATSRLVLLAFVVPAAIATAGLAWDYIFYFLDPCAGGPCAGRHLLLLAIAKSKQEKALHPTTA